MKVIFSNGANFVFKNVVGNGAAQTVALTTAEVATLGAGTIQVNAQTTDAAGNISTTAQSSFVIDNVAPSVASVTPVDNATAVAVTDNIVITLSENVQAGTGNFVIDNGAGDVRTISVTDATQVTVLNNTVTINPIGDLVGNSNYNVTYAAGVLTDTAGNALAAQTSTVAQNFTTTAPIDPTVVVFDLVNGVSSDHSGRIFDPNVSYTIYVVVDATSAVLNTTPQAGANAAATFGIWNGANNLGADDSIFFSTSTGAPIVGVNGNVGTTPMTANLYSSGSTAWTGSLDKSWAAYLTEMGSINRFTINSNRSTDLWSSSWATLGNSPRPAGIMQTLPVGLLTSQGLV